MRHEAMPQRGQPAQTMHGLERRRAQSVITHNVGNTSSLALYPSNTAPIPGLVLIAPPVSDFPSPSHLA